MKLYFMANNEAWQIWAKNCDLTVLHIDKGLANVANQHFEPYPGHPYAGLEVKFFSSLPFGQVLQNFHLP